MQNSSTRMFSVLSSDNLIYGPIDLATLIQWVRERRLEPDTWILLAPENQWAAAGSLDFLSPEFRLLDSPAESTSVNPSDSAEVTVAELRGFERFQPYSNAELELLVSFCDVVEAAPMISS